MATRKINRVAPLLRLLIEVLRVKIGQPEHEKIIQLSGLMFFDVENGLKHEPR